jgi:hypothetical protein
MMELIFKYLDWVFGGESELTAVVRYLGTLLAIAAVMVAALILFT